MFWLSTALAGPALSVQQFPGDAGAQKAEEYLWSVPADNCVGEDLVVLTWDVSEGEIAKVRTKPENICWNKAVLGAPPADLVDGHYVAHVDYAFDDKILLAIIGTTGDGAGSVEDLFVDGGDLDDLDAALAASGGIALAPSITVVQGPEGASFPGEVAGPCDGKQGSNTPHRAELIFIEGYAKVQSVSPQDAFAECLEVELSRLRHGAFNGPIVIDVVATH